MAWLEGWDKRRIKFTVDETKIDTADLTWFRVIVTLSPTHGDCVFDELTSDANRFKIAFTKADGTTELYGEIEKWDDANESAIIHVSRDEWVISNTENTDFYMYYDKDHADNTTYIGEMPARYALYLPEISGTGNPASAYKAITAVNCTGLTKANGYLQIDLKCSVPANMTAIGQLELTSAAGEDAHEWALNDLTGLGITTAYQTFYIPLSDWVTTGGELDVATINWIRWWNYSSSGNITISWKNAYIIITTDIAKVTANITAANSVWDGNKKLVTHMVDITTSTAIVDSTSNNNNGWKKGAGEPASATGKVGLGQDFDGANDFISIVDNASLKGMSAITVEAWINPDSIAAGVRTIIGKWYNGIGGADRPYLLEQNAAQVTFGINGQVLATTNSPLAAGVWCHIVGVYDSAGTHTKSIYINGELNISDTASSGAIQSTNTINVTLGLDWVGSNHWFNGLMDEVHIDAIARTAGWIKAEYNSLWDTLIAYGSEETGTTLLEFSETLSIADTMATSGTLAKAETLSIIDTKIMSGLLGFIEALSIVDSWSGLLTFFETLSIVDSKFLTGTLGLDETLEIVDSATFQCIKTFYETLSIIDTITTSGSLNLAETISIVDSWTVLKTFFETLSITDTVAMGGSLNVSEIISIIDSFIRWIGHPIFTEPTKSSLSYTEPTKTNPVYTKPAKGTTSFTKPAKTNPVYTKPTKEHPIYTEPTKEIRLD